MHKTFNAKTRACLLNPGEKNNNDDDDDTALFERDETMDDDDGNDDDDETTFCWTRRKGEDGRKGGKGFCAMMMMMMMNDDGDDVHEEEETERPPPPTFAYRAQLRCAKDGCDACERKMRNAKTTTKMVRLKRPEECERFKTFQKKKKTLNGQEEEKEKGNHIGLYEKGDRILTVGDGDLTFY